MLTSQEAKRRKPAEARPSTRSDWARRCPQAIDRAERVRAASVVDMESGERSPKVSPLSVVFYEIHMLRHATRYLEPEVLERRDHVANAWQEVYLLHYRNLIEFFKEPNPRHRPRRLRRSIYRPAENLIYLKPMTWAARDIPRDDLMPAVRLAMPLHAEHWEQISCFLQHCTDWRHELRKIWDYPAMHEKMEEVLQEMLAVMQRHRLEVPAPMS